MSLTFSIVRDLRECERLWKELSPGESLFDLWEYRMNYFDPGRYAPHFIVGSQGGKIGAGNK